jgi:hypothetical protein
LSVKQPLLIHGLSANADFILPSAGKISHGINLVYRYFRSAAENENFNAVLNLHFLNPGYFLHWENPEKQNHFYFDAGLSVTMGVLFRKVNDEILRNDEKSIKAFGIGAELNFKAGYQVKLNEKLVVSPFMKIGYVPFFYSPIGEALLNQTKELTGKDWTGILTFQVGILVHLKKG